MQQQPEVLILPDLVTLCPFPLRVNPFYKQIRVESAKWIMSFNAFTGKKRDHYVASDLELFAAYTFPDATYDQVRVCADLLNLLSTIDMMCDDLDGDNVPKVGHQYIAALVGSPMDASMVSGMVAEFKQSWDRHVSADSCTRRRHIEHSRWYFIRLTREAELREHSTHFNLDLEAFMQFRRENSGLYQCFDFIELVNNIELPDEVTEDKTFKQTYHTGLDICWLANDIVSFAMEQSLGLDEANSIAFLHRSRGMTMQEATDHSGTIFLNLLDKFMQGRQEIRSFGADVDRAVKLYIEGMENWIVGNIHWSYDSQRYFGKRGQEVKLSGVAKLGPVELQ